MSNKSQTIELHLLEHSATKNDWAAIKAARRGRPEEEWYFMKAEDFHDKRKFTNFVAQKSLNIGELDLGQIFEMLPERVGTLSDQPGWVGSDDNKRFVLFDHILTEDHERCIFYYRPVEARGLGRVAGNLEDWKSKVAKVALSSYPATIGLLASFAAPLLPLSNISEGAILNFVAKSSSGKSTIVKAAYSVWGDPQFLPSWGGTMSAISQTASAHNHLICPFDDGELAELDPHKRNMKLHSFTHLLADGIPWQYSKTVRDEHKASPSLALFYHQIQSLLN